MASYAIRREALRGVEERIFDLLSLSCSPGSWAEVLKPMLNVAAGKGDASLAQKLVAAGAEPGAAMRDAIWSGSVEVVDMLLENGASAADNDSNGDAPLHVAARAGTQDVARSLLLKGAEKDALCERSRTPLIFASQHGHVGVAEALLAAGADPTLRADVDNADRSALEIAAERGHVNVMRVMIQHGIDVDDGGALAITALHLAASEDNVDAIHLLMEAGANIHKRNFLGNTPLHLAAIRQPNVGAALALLEHGAIINTQDDKQQTTLHGAARMAGVHGGSSELVDLLLRWGANEKVVDEAGLTPADVVGDNSDEYWYMTTDSGDVERVRKLLVDAPVDRAWRRRGLLVLCRSHPDKVQLRQDDEGCLLDVAGGDSQRPHRRVKGVCTPGGGRRDWVSFMARVVGLQEEGIFRSIVRYI